MSWDAYEALAARDPRLGRTILVDLGRGLAARLRAAGRDAPGVDGMTAFPNYTQIPTRLLGRHVAGDPRRDAARGGRARDGARRSSPTTRLDVMWKGVIPALPLLWLVVPGLWRNICPLSASNQTPRVLGLSKARTAPPWLKEYGFVIGAGMFIAFVSLRKLGLDDSGPASALLLLGALSGAYVGGTLLKGKSGWCSSICPLLPVQRLYGQTPYKLVANSHCTPCVGCTKNCYDFNPKVAFLADLNDPDPYWSGYKKLFAAAFPGLVLGVLQPARGARRARRSRRLYGAARALPRGLAPRSSTRSTRC